MTINTQYYKHMTLEFLFTHSLIGKDLVIM